VPASIARTATLAILDDAVDRAGNAKHYLEQQAAREPATTHPLYAADR
jgi:hypothetical protein